MRVLTLLFMFFTAVSIVLATMAWSAEPYFHEGKFVPAGTVRGGCVGAEAMEDLKAAVEADGDEGYANYISDPDTLCADYRYGHTVIVQDTEAVGIWGYIFHPRGTIFVVWELRDVTGRELDSFYTWEVEAEANPEPGGEDV